MAVTMVDKKAVQMVAKLVHLLVDMMAVMMVAKMVDMMVA